MTPEEKRIRIAELDGWTKVHMHYGSMEDARLPDELRGTSPLGYKNWLIPDYLNNRDAIVEAIKRKFQICAEKSAFEDELEEILGDDYTDFGIATATAEQLADAYLEAAN